MFWSRWTRGGRSFDTGYALYAAAVAQARDPAFYAALGAPDTANGRFELYSLHVILLLHRLKRRGEAAAEAGQALFDIYVKALDNTLREQGVGDLSMSKKMRKLGEAFYGRVRSYDAALETPEELPALVRRTVYEETAGDAEALADYVIRARDTLAGQPDEALLGGAVQWPEVRP
jgi:cytochrome b pre-mRNA-processing protein 3